MKLTLLTLALAAAGCANPARSLTDVGGAAGGAYLGNRLSGGKPGWAAAGAAGGVALSEGAWTLAERAQGKAINAGMAKARSDAVKDLYWSKQRDQRPTATPPVLLYPINLPEQEIDGVIYQPSTRVLRINQ